MSDRRITFFELHTHGPIQFGPSSLARGEESAEEPTPTERHEAATEGGRSKLPLLVLALVVAGGVGLAVRKFRGGEDEEPDEVPLAESDDVHAAAD